MPINENAAYRYDAACLLETTHDNVGLDLFRCWRNREPVYDLQMSSHRNDLTVTLSREELKKLGEALIRLANATFLEPASSLPPAGPE